MYIFEISTGRKRPAHKIENINIDTNRMYFVLLLATLALQFGTFFSPVNGILNTWTPGDTTDPWDIPYKHNQDLIPYTEVLDRQTALDLLARTLQAIRRGLYFMKESARDINLDGVIGTRLVEGKRFHGLVLHSSLNPYFNVLMTLCFKLQSDPKSVSVT